MTSNRRFPEAGERGMALVLVLIVLVLTSILALEIKSAAFLHSKLAKNQRDDFLMQQAMQGQLEIMKQVLLFDMKENQTESSEDRWNDEKYTRFQKGPSEEDEESDEPREEPVSSEEYQITARVEDEARKFNLHNLEIEDDAQRKIWEEIFLRLLVLYREESSELGIGRGRAEELLDNLKEWLKRRDDDRGVPRPTTAVEGQVLVTPDELLMVKGFTREMFYDQRPDREGGEVQPGLYRYLTLWSEGRVNPNTAEPVLVRALFTERDDDLASALLEYREAESEEQPESAAVDDEPLKNVLKTVADLSNIDGFDSEAIQRNNLGATLAFSGNRFSVDMLGEAGDGLRHQERWILERNAEGVTTLLAEERNDPVPETEEDLEE